jgi:hypothetical protein
MKCFYKVPVRQFIFSQPYCSAAQTAQGIGNIPETITLPGAAEVLLIMVSGFSIFSQGQSDVTFGSIV